MYQGPSLEQELARLEEPDSPVKEKKDSKEKREVRTRTWHDQLLDVTVNAGVMWFAAKLWYLDGYYTLLVPEKLGWMPKDWLTGIDIPSIGTLSIWWAIPMLFSIIQWRWFPVGITKRKVELRVRGVKLALWAVVSFINMGTTYTGLSFFIQDHAVLPLWSSIVLPTTGMGLFILCFIGSFCFSQGPEFLGRRATTGMRETLRGMA